MSANIIPNCNCFCNHNRTIILRDKVGGCSKYVADNPNINEIDCYHVDGCVTSIQKKCDYLLLNLNQLNAYLIELKGSDLLNAIEQLNSTLDFLITRLANYNINARVVLTKVYAPDLLTSKFLRFRKRINSLNGTIIQKTGKQLVEQI